MEFITGEEGKYITAMTRVRGVLKVCCYECITLCVKWYVIFIQSYKVDFSKLIAYCKP